MYARLKTSKQSRNSTIQIVEGVRHGKKVRQRVVASLGIVGDKKNLKRIFRLAESLIRKIEEQGLPIPQKIEIKKLLHTATVYDGFGTVVDRLMDLVGFSALVRSAQGKHRFNLEEAVKLMITQRLDTPSSKLRTCERQKRHGFVDVDVHHLYRALDAIAPLKNEIQAQAFKIVQATSSCGVDCFFFDVTTLYFESVQQDELREFGFSKDQKHHSVQIVLALVVDREGLPLAYETFKGNLAETKTLIPVLERLRENFSVQNVTVVCDRGLASRANIEALQSAGFRFVIATKLRSISEKHEINDLSSYQPLPYQESAPEDERLLFRTMDHPQYPNTVLISTYSPARAEKDRRDRERLLEKLCEKLGDTPNESSVKKVITNSGYKKYLSVKNGSKVVLNQTGIDDDAMWDGFHGIAVSRETQLSPAEALARYRDLWHIEETFRVMKSTLGARPIFHWVPHRIQAHVLICFMTLFIERFLEHLLRKNNTPIAPEKIRDALSQVHTMYFKESDTKRTAKVESSLTNEAMEIFAVLGLPFDRTGGHENECCA